jgi:acyl-CoA dehydrogenase family protein 9
MWPRPRTYHVSVAEFELIKFNLAKCAGRIYALESMLYLTAGLQDVGIKPDVEVESACVKQFAVETSDFVTRRCLDMLGAQTNLRDSPFQQFLAENQVLQSWQGSNNILKCFIAISGKSRAYLHLRYFFHNVHFFPLIFK